MILNRSKFAELLLEKFKDNYSNAAKSFGVTPQYVHKLMKDDKSAAGATILGGLASYCFQERLNFWDYVFLPNNQTKV